MKPLIVAACVLLAGCVVLGPWTQPGKTDAQAQQDLRECEYDAAKATAGTINAMQAGWEQGSLETQCMRVRGYTRKPVR
jgi:hypothetical protein